ncbi:hypothetical protein HJG60_010765 [Phyllostomus discolor]|uniref:Syncytin-2-like n=1 Tax=Phyllostomus discolor TaxID=89673 RepID=A0A7E6DX61_9CHIR|nr:syncytin-2-like [Phyllostomus discolor]KAF6109490.1 hypothetical protein HJG60_010765 [Phyllostomus discolor]
MMPRVPVRWWRTSGSFATRLLLSLISSFLFYPLAPFTYAKSPPKTAYELDNHTPQSFNSPYPLSLSNHTSGYVQPLALEQWGNISATLDENTVHFSPWGIIAAQNLAKRLPRTFSTSSQRSPRGPVFSHLINHLQVTYPLCIVSDAPGGTPVGRLADSQCRQNLLIPDPPLTNTTRGIPLTAIPHMSGGIPNPGDETNFIHTRFPGPAVPSPPLYKNSPKTAYCQGRPSYSVNHFLPQEGEDCVTLYRSSQVAVHFGPKRGSIFTEAINSPSFCNPVIDPLAAASLAAQGLQWWGTKYPRTRQLVKGRYVSVETQPVKLAEIELMAELPPLTGVFWVCGSQAYWTLPPQWRGHCSLGYVSTK